jgi:hypothetical protein
MRNVNHRDDARTKFSNWWQFFFSHTYCVVGYSTNQRLVAYLFARRCWRWTKLDFFHCQSQVKPSIIFQCHIERFFVGIILNSLRQRTSQIVFVQIQADLIGSERIQTTRCCGRENVAQMWHGIGFVFVVRHGERRLPLSEILTRKNQKFKRNFNET